MNKLRKLSFVLFLVVVATFIFFGQSVYATDGVVETNFFGNIEDDNEGCGVFMILNSAIDIISMGIAILGVIGVTIVGINYLTAKDSEEKTRKAKNRMFEIVIGLAVYAVLFVGAQWLLPGGRMSNSCNKISDDEMAAIRKKEQSGKQSSASGTASSKSSKSSSSSSYNKTKAYKTCMKKALFKDKTVRDKVCQLKKGSERIAKTAELLAASSKKASVQCYPLTWKPKKWSQFKRCAPTKYFQYAYDKVRPDHWKKYTNYVKNVVRTGASCDYYVGTVVRASGYDGIGLSHDSMHSNMTKDTKKWKKVKKAQRGDICQKYSGNGAHIKIYLGNGKIAEASSGLQTGDKRWGGVTSGGCGGYTIYRATK